MSTQEYIVVPFRPTLGPKDKYADIALQVHELMNLYLSKGWEYVAIEKIEAQIKMGRLQEDQHTAVQVMIFRK